MSNRVRHSPTRSLRSAGLALVAVLVFAWHPALAAAQTLAPADVLRNVERAILAGVVSETTTAMVQDREARRRTLKARLVASDARRGTVPLPVDAATITAQLVKLNELLGRDVARANAFFRAHLAPILCVPVQEAGRRFYRASVAAKGTEIIKSLGLVPQAFDFGGCGGWI